ncbi:MAG: hypothetical protein K2Y14_12905 [Burkholderiales bacterium]|nr:hypothetical protein [Burkholderiales bacterium]
MRITTKDIIKLLNKQTQNKFSTCHKCGLEAVDMITDNGYEDVYPSVFYMQQHHLSKVGYFSSMCQNCGFTEFYSEVFLMNMILEAYNNGDR